MIARLLAGISIRWADMRAQLRSLRWLLAWPLLAALLAIIGWSAVLTFLDNKRQEIENRALHETAVLANTYARHLESRIDTLDQILHHVKYEWMLTRGQLRLESIAESDLFPPASDLTVAILDRDGKLLTWTRRLSKAMLLSDQPFFQAHKKLGFNFLYLGNSRTDWEATNQSIQLSRRLDDSAGRFAGVVMISVVPEYFIEYYDETTLGQGGFLGMFAADGSLLAGRIGAKISTPNSTALAAAPHFVFKSGSALVGGPQRFADSRSRYIGWRILNAHPIVALVGQDRQSAMAPYADYRAFSIRYAMLATVALFAGAFVAMGFSMRLSARRRQLEMTQAAYRMATEEGIEGFYIFRPVRDSRGLIADFKVMDCNGRGAELFNLRREQVSGKRISALPDSMQSLRWFEILHSAMAAGAYENEVEMPAAGVFPVRWLHIKIARSGDNLAVRVSDISTGKAHVAELERRGNEDALTGLPNRHWANAYLPKAIERAGAAHAMLALLFIDLDGFKAVNDSLGHEAGDELLRNAGRRLKLAVRPRDHVVRIGGDEFVVIIEDIGHASDASQVAERVVHAFHAAFSLPQGLQSVGTSIGISVFPGDGADADTLLRNADIAMYSVKTSGKRNYRFYDAKFYEALRARMEKEAELRHAVQHDQFVIYYQPRVDISTGTTSSMEALVRWMHPAKGLINPQEFIPMAEETGVILELGALVIEKVCAQLAAWARTGQELVPVSINVSPQQFSDANIADILKKSLAWHRIDPGLIEIELTESSMMGDSREVSATLDAIQRLGVRLLVDDFGTGYSSLSQLQRLDFDVLKVDQTFTARLEKSEEGSIFFNAIITMAHALGMRVVAEGVETFDQVKLLKSLQCDEIQGFFVSKPLPPAETQPILPKWFFPSTA
ncbi:MAG: EAL domain-containing protein [Burkholderiales bacterium]|nr:EAL domain-containing protein [Burkholderiales bacterium]